MKISLECFELVVQRKNFYQTVAESFELAIQMMFLQKCFGASTETVLTKMWKTINGPLNAAKENFTNFMHNAQNIVEEFFVKLY